MSWLQNVSGEGAMRLLLLLNSFLLLGLICTNAFHFVSDSRKQVTTIGILQLLSSRVDFT